MNLNVYLIKYDEYGNVCLLYCGNFSDGQFEDNTGDAWYITRNDNTNYMYYKGKFKNGGPDKSAVYEFRGDLTIKDINTYIEGRTFNVELRWAFTESMQTADKN